MYDALVCGTDPRGSLMLAQSNIIRDVGRALPALVSGPDLGVPVSRDLLDAHATALREQYDSLLPVIDRAGNALSKAMERHDPKETADPDGEGARALEQTEAYFKNRRDELGHLRGAFLDAGASSSHDAIAVLDRLDTLFMWIVAVMQEVRWSVLILDGVRDAVDSPARRTFATSSEWVAALHGD